MKLLAKFLNIELTHEMYESAHDFYTPKLKHHQIEMDNFSGETPVYLKDFIKILQKGELDQPNKLDKIFDEFYWSQELFMYDARFLRENIKSSELTISNLQSDKATLEYQHLKIKEDIKHIKNTLTELKKKTFTNYSLTKTNFIMPSLNLVDVIIPVYNALEYVKNCIKSVLDNNDGLVHKVILVNDGSDSETTGFLKNIAKTNDVFILIELGENRGYTKAVNVGLTQSTAEICGFIK